MTLKRRYLCFAETKKKKIRATTIATEPAISIVGIVKDGNSKKDMEHSEPFKKNEKELSLGVLIFL